MGGLRVMEYVNAGREMLVLLINVTIACFATVICSCSVIRNSRAIQPSCFTIKKNGLKYIIIRKFQC